MPDHPAKPPQTLWCRITALLLAAGFIFGIGIVALLPPFEGADETAHFARIQAQAFPPTSPSAKAGNLITHFSNDVVDYYGRGPMPYQWISHAEASGAAGHYMTYGAFFAAPSQTDYVKAYWESPLPAAFRPGVDINWQYQHPPLFYLAMIPVMKALAGHASLITTLLALRLLCYVMAFAGFVIGLLATRVYLRHTGWAGADKIIALGAFYPFLMPEFFWEFARLGNDSLCLFFFGVAWALLLWHMIAPRSDAWIYLGVTLGLSLLVKALMISAAAAVVVFVAAYHFFALRGNPLTAKGWWAAPLKIGALTLLVALPIYLLNYTQGGNVGAINFQAALAGGNMWALLKQHFAWHDFLINVSGMIRTAVWLFGTWSLIIIDLPVYKALVALAALVFAFYIAAARRGPGIFLHALPLWLIAVFFTGLLSNVLVAFIVQNKDATPGYYMHILAPALALVYGAGLARALRQRWSKILMALLCAPVLLLNFVIALSYMTAFSGCAVPVHDGAVYRLHIADILHCAGSFGEVINRLGVLAWPGLALICMGAAFMLLIAAMWLTLRAAGTDSGGLR